MSSSTSVDYTPEGAVTVSYEILKSSPQSLKDSIERAFGSDPASLGIIIVRDLPPVYVDLRARLLNLADAFANLDESTKEKYVDVKSRYSFGWSHGKEIMNGRPDTLKGSFYANPVLDAPDVTNDDALDYPEYYGRNIWPTKDEKGVEGFEEAFKDLGRFIYDVGRELAVACQPFAAEHLKDLSLSLSDLISPRTTKARLLHYFPPSPKETRAVDEPVDSWCGFHLDHSLLTGLCSAIYLQRGDLSVKVVPSPSPQSGLYVRDRGGKLTKVSIPADCLAFQTGEALELATNGKLRATPHCVRVGGGGNALSVSRETFALFMQPDTKQQIGEKESFGQFSKRVFDKHYEQGLVNA